MVWKKSRFIRILAGVIALSMITAGCMQGYAQEEPGAEGAEPETEGTADTAPEAEEYIAPPTPVEVHEMQKTSLENRQTFVGKVEPAQTMSVISRLSAEVTAVHVEVGQRVNEGDLLFTLDTTDLNESIASLQASLAASEAGLATAQVQIERAQYGLERAQQDSAQAELQQAQADSALVSAYDGLRSLKGSRSDLSDSEDDLEDDLADAKDLVSLYEDALEAAKANYDQAPGNNEAKEAKEAYEDAQSDLQDARGMVRSLEDALNSIENQQDVLDRQVTAAEHGVQLAQDAQPLTGQSIQEGKEAAIKEAEFGIQQAEAGAIQAERGAAVYEVQLQAAQTKLGYAEVRSPINGIVSSRNLEVGQMVSTAAAPITIVDMDTIHATVGVTETLINMIQVGNEVDVVVQAVSGQVFTGTVSVVHPVATQSGTYTVEVAIDNTGGMIKPGMFAQVSFVKEASGDTFVVDKSAVIEEDDGSFVYIIVDGLAVQKPVTLGISDGVQVEVLSGISAGDQIVVTGQEYLIDGVAVNIVGEK